MTNNQDQFGQVNYISVVCLALAIIGFLLSNWNFYIGVSMAVIGIVIYIVYLNPNLFAPRRRMPPKYVKKQEAVDIQQHREQ